ncbi:Rib/alpha-like domain-containing protein [uncultured Corynebacterium sp.]|uniref:Rib/alpha-like domain-containing protein n=1 Tax=uncultured Corynebacterium sp. TaxID=159447 RepID=UPI0025ED612C|nr:Rib/alpha-like domain-containing protein [uncultured Corynebacterium sp.]
MKSKKMMSLLTATALSGGIITAAVVTPSIVAAAESMADQHQPSYVPAAGSTNNLISFSSLTSAEELPDGTQFHLENNEDYLVVAGIYVRVKDDGKIVFSVWNGPGAQAIPVSGTTITVPITVAYPDQSSEVITAELTLAPPHDEGFDVVYDAPSVEQGTTATLHPADEELPEGTSIEVIDSATTLNLQDSGWEFSAEENAALTVVAPEEVTGPIHLQLRVSYPDGTSELATTMVEVIDPTLPQPEVIDPTPPQADNPGDIYPVGAITQGALATISPDDSLLPDGTTISLVDDSQLQDLLSAGWDIHVGDENVLFYTAPFAAKGPATVNLLVDYPDGTQSETTAAIHVHASNLAGHHDVSYPDTAILAGGSAIIAPVTTDLPADTTITLVEDTALEAARHAGWSLTINDTGRIAISTQESIVDGRNVVNVLISYPDGTSEVTAVDLLALPQPTPEEAEGEAPTKAHPVPWSSWGFFGSS